MNLRELRKRRGLSLEAAALIAGVDPSTLSRIERGITTPRPETIVRLSTALGLSARRMAGIIRAGSEADGPETDHLVKEHDR